MQQPADHRLFTQRVLIVTGIAVLALVLLYFLHLVAQVLLIFFAGCLLGILLDGAAHLVSDHTPISRRWALLAACLLIAAAAVAMGWFAGARILDQLSELGARLPQAFQQLREWVMQIPWVQSAMENLPKPGKALDGGLLSRLTDLFSIALGGLVSTVIIIFVGLYLAATPHLYTSLAVHLLPQRHRKRGYQVLEVLARALRRWLIGRLASMLVIGLLTWLVLWLMDLPLALPLGLVAGLLSFVPYLGPVLSAVPGVLIGFSESPQTALYVALAYWGVQMVESYVITPLIERKAVLIPPAYQITAQLMAAVLAGFMGILLASPLVVVGTVLVQLLYLEDLLGDSPHVVGD